MVLWLIMTFTVRIHYEGQLICVSHCSNSISVILQQLVKLSTLFLDRLPPTKHLTSTKCTYFCRCSLWVSRWGRMAVEILSWSIFTKGDGLGLELMTPGFVVRLAANCAIEPSNDSKDNVRLTFTSITYRLFLVCCLFLTVLTGTASQLVTVLIRLEIIIIAAGQNIWRKEVL